MAKRPKFDLTPIELTEIKEMAERGLKNEDIALIKRISESSLKRKAKGALAEGRAGGKNTIQKTAFIMAKSGKFPAMTIFWLKTQCGWREQDRVNSSDIPKPPDIPKEKLPTDPLEAAKIYQKIMTGE